MDMVDVGLETMLPVLFSSFSPCSMFLSLTLFSTSSLFPASTMFPPLPNQADTGTEGALTCSSTSEFLLFLESPGFLVFSSSLLRMEVMWKKSSSYVLWSRTACKAFSSSGFSLLTSVSSICTRNGWVGWKMLLMLRKKSRKDFPSDHQWQKRELKRIRLTKVDFWKNESLNMIFCVDEPVYTISNDMKGNDPGKFRNWTSNLNTRMWKTSNEIPYSTSTTTSSVSNFAGSGFDCVKEEVINNLEIEIWVKNSKLKENQQQELKRATSCPKNIWGFQIKKTNIGWFIVYQFVTNDNDELQLNYLKCSKWIL